MSRTALVLPFADLLALGTPQQQQQENPPKKKIGPIERSYDAQPAPAPPGPKSPIEGTPLGVTFVDVVVSHEEFSDDLLFHELVHVAQYAQLGSKEFSLRYVNGFIKSRSYEGIPLEEQARELEARFSGDPKQPFSVADEVRKWLEAGKL